MSGNKRCGPFDGASLESGHKNVLFLALARLINAVAVAQRRQLLDMLARNPEPVPTGVAATDA